MSGTLRDLIQQASDVDLLVMWAEHMQFEDSGVLAPDAVLRRYADLHFGDRSKALHLMAVGHEMWRECACRALLSSDAPATETRP